MPSFCKCFALSAIILFFFNFYLLLGGAGGGLGLGDLALRGGGLLCASSPLRQQLLPVGRCRWRAEERQHYPANSPATNRRPVVSIKATQKLLLQRDKLLLPRESVCESECALFVWLRARTVQSARAR